MQNNQYEPKLIKVLIATAIFYWLADRTESWVGTELAILYYLLFGLCCYMAVVAGFCLIRNTLRLLWRWWVTRPGDRSGSADWASGWNLWRAKLYRKHGVLLGLFKSKFPVFFDLESSGMVLSPAGGGKTSCFVLVALWLIGMSMLITDLKCTLAPMTAKMRKKRFGHKIICLNPAGYHKKILGESARYNPLIILMDAWKNPDHHRFLITDAQAIAKQLCEDPPRLTENQYFRSGSRKYLVFAMVYLVVTKAEATLTDVLIMLSDQDSLLAALQVAKVSKELNGDLERIAKDLLTKIEKGDPKQTESFREGAVQSLEVFAPSGTLAECTSSCTFRFSELKKSKLSIFLMADPTRQAVYAPWLGLLAFCAIVELIRSPSTKRVMFMLDEVCNFKIQGLPALLTLVREFKISMWLILQDLQQWGVVYGTETIQTLLSQTEAKIFMQVRSHETCKLVSDMLGDQTISAKNHNLGTSLTQAIAKSVHDGPRKLMTPDEVRQCDDTIVIIKGYKPARLQRISYHQISPIKHQVGINPLFGKKYKGWTKLRL